MGALEFSNQGYSSFTWGKSCTQPMKKSGRNSRSKRIPIRPSRFISCALSHSNFTSRNATNLSWLIRRIQTGFVHCHNASMTVPLSPLLASLYSPKKFLGFDSSCSCVDLSPKHAFYAWSLWNIPEKFLVEMMDSQTHGYRYRCVSGSSLWNPLRAQEVRRVGKDECSILPKICANPDRPALL
ncbi:hypothetical protein AWB69_03869 [Caballeronia udeis]|uniref:Uncharacterized protein n=1 Tax=Caballeronia udeis TaxID=1232866 RepID=A0A158H4G0_9BURK|nr:hypothetical protein AWB69_03869 [Caballeronia udeis]